MRKRYLKLMAIAVSTVFAASNCITVMAEDPLLHDDTIMNEAVDSKLSGMAASLDKDGYSFKGFSVSKADLLALLKAAGESAGSKEKKDALDEAIAKVRSYDGDQVPFTDENGALLSGEGSLQQVLSLMLGGGVDSVDVSADWDKIVKEIYLYLGDRGYSIYYKDKTFYADQGANIRIGSITDLEEYLRSQSVEDSLMMQDASGHFAGLYFADNSKDAGQRRVLLADHVGNIVFDENDAGYRVADTDTAYVIRNHVVTVDNGSSTRDIYTDGNRLYENPELTDKLDGFRSVGEEFFVDSEDGHFGGYKYSNEDGTLFADHNGNLVSEDVGLNTDMTVVPIRNHYLVFRNAAGDILLYSDGQLLYVDPELTAIVTNAKELSGDIISDNGGHLFAYFLEDEAGEPIRDESGARIPVLAKDGEFNLQGGIGSDVYARAQRYRIISLCYGDDLSEARNVYYSEGAFYADEGLSEAVEGALYEASADGSRGHFAGIFAVGEDGNYMADGEGSRVALLDAGGNLVSYDDVAGRLGLGGDVSGRAIYYRHLQRIAGENDVTGYAGLYSDDQKLYNSPDLSNVAYSISLPIPEDLSDVGVLYIYDSYAAEDGDEAAEERIVFTLTPVFGERVVEGHDEDSASQEGSFDEENEEIEVESYLQGYVAYNIDGTAVFTVDPDGNIDYNSTNIEPTKVDREAEKEKKKDDAGSAASTDDEGSASSSASSGSSEDSSSSASSGSSEDSSSSASSDEQEDGAGTGASGSEGVSDEASAGSGSSGGEPSAPDADLPDEGSGADGNDDNESGGDSNDNSGSGSSEGAEY